MAEKELPAKIADTLNAKPGVEAVNIASPVVVEMKPSGQWESLKPGKIDEENLRAVVNYLLRSNAISAAQSYCSHCASNSQKSGGKSDYVPVIVMPIHPAPPDTDSGDTNKDGAQSKPKPTKANTGEDSLEQKEKETRSKNKKKRGFVLQRFTDFDLLSQW